MTTSLQGPSFDPLLGARLHAGRWPGPGDALAGDRALRGWGWKLAAAVLGLAVLSLLLRPLLPVDETRYLTVAWEMWQRGQWLLPTLNGELYDHKPPLLFWLVHAGWAVTGVGETWPRLIGPLASLASLALVARLGRRLWPSLPAVGPVAALMLVSGLFYSVYQTAFMFDLPLLAFVLLGWGALHAAACRGGRGHWLAYGLAFAAAMLTKGPVAMVYLLPPLLLARAWMPSGSPPLGWRGPLLALAVALSLPLLWLLLADRQSGGELLGRVLLDQTLGRVQGELGHPRPWFWYLPLLPLLGLPWLAWPTVWRALRAATRQAPDAGLRFVLATALPGLLVLSAVSGKQVHYLIPLLALAALALARALQGLPAAPGAVRAPLASAVVIAGASLAVVAAAMVLAFAVIAPRYDLAEAARHVGAQQRLGREAMYVGNYQGEFGFLGRLQAPVQELAPSEALAWARRHPDGLVIARAKRLRLQGAPAPEFTQRYKSDQLLMFRASRLLASGSGFRDPSGDGSP